MGKFKDFIKKHNKALTAAASAAALGGAAYLARKPLAAPFQMASAMGGRRMKAYRKGGYVKKTGPALVHRGELVMTSRQVQKARQYRASK